MGAYDCLRENAHSCSYYTIHCRCHFTADLIPRSAFLLGRKGPGRKRGAVFCRNMQAAAKDHDGLMDCTASSQPLTVTCSAAVFMLASIALGIGAASASSCAFRSELPGFLSLPLVRDELKVVCDSADLEASRFSSTSRVTALHILEGDNASCSTAREFMQVHAMENYECDAHDACIDSEIVRGKLRHALIERMQDASAGLSKSQSKSSCTTLERSAEDNDMDKPSQDWGSVPLPFKLTVPLRIVSLRGSLPPIWLKDFLLSQGKRVRLSVEYQNSLNEIMSALQSAVEKKRVTPKSILAADLVTIGDSWLPLAVSVGLIQPIKNADQQEWFKRLNANWQDFVRRDQDGGLNPEGLIWGVPYRWGSMVIAYKRDQLLKNNIPALEDWGDLWRPELKGQIAMVDSPREVVGAVLKSLGASYNAKNFDCDVKGGKEAVKRQFLALQKQVKVFDSVHYLKAFGSDDIWVAVGWSSDVLPVAKRMSNVRVVIPKSGVSLWADFWAIPTANSISTKKIGARVHTASPLIHQWFDFCLQPARSSPFKQGIFTGVSPLSNVKGDFETKAEQQRSMINTLGKAMELTFEAVKNNTTGPAMDTNMTEGMPPKNCLDKSELLEPLSDKAVVEYQWLFSQAAEEESFRKEVVEKVKGFLNGTASSSRKG